MGIEVAGQTTSAERTITGLKAIPSFPPVALRVLELLACDPLDLEAVASGIESDAVFAGRMLQHANSAEFGFVSPVDNVPRALTLLGGDRVREIAATVAASQYVQAARKTDELRRCWRHTVATAVLSDTIARAAGVHTQQAYTAGLMHDIGRLAIFVAYPEEYIKVMRDAASQCIDLLDFERECFGMEHAEAGRWLIEYWRLPEYFRVIAGRHHDSPDGAGLDLLTIIHVACRLADSLQFDVTRPLLPVSVPEVLAVLPERVRKNIHDDANGLKTLIEHRIASFDRRNAPPEPGGIEAAADDIIEVAIGEGTTDCQASGGRPAAVTIAIVAASAIAAALIVTLCVR